MIYTSIQGDRVDTICKSQFGTEHAGIVEIVYELNPGLAAYGPVLPTGVEITLPDTFVEPTKQASIKLWD